MEYLLKEIAGSDGPFYISGDGKVFRKKDGALKEVPIQYLKTGYAIVNIKYKERQGVIYLQSEVMKAFGKDMDKKEWNIVHIDGDKKNNTIENLKWVPIGEARGSRAQRIEVYDTLTGETTTYDTLTSAAQAHRICNPMLKRVLDGEYSFVRSNNKNKTFKRI